MNNPLHTVGHLGGAQDAAAYQGSLKTAHGAGVHCVGQHSGKASAPAPTVSLGGEAAGNGFPATLSLYLPDNRAGRAIACEWGGPEK